MSWLEEQSQEIDKFYDDSVNKMEAINTQFQDDPTPMLYVGFILKALGRIEKRLAALESTSADIADSTWSLRDE